MSGSIFVLLNVIIHTFIAYSAMPSNTTLPLATLERWSSTAFLAGALMFVVAAGFNAADVMGGVGHTRLPLKQAVISAGWVAASVGLLGLYPALADRSRRLSRAGAVFTVIGILGYAVMGVLSLADYVGVLGTGFESYAIVFFPPVLVGSLLTFPLFGVASLRSNAHSRTLGLLLPGPTLLFVANMLTPTPPSVVLVVVSGLVVVCFGIGYVVRTEDVTAGRTETATGPTTD